jgi:uncharacterized protein (TIGR02266 family)
MSLPPPPSAQNYASRVQRKPRIAFPKKVWLRNQKQNQALETYASNISESGIFVQTTDPPEIGTQISLQFHLENNDQTIEAIAEVIWIKQFEPINIDGILPGLGARFTSIDAVGRNHLREYISNELPKAKTPEMVSDDETSDIAEFPLEKPLALQIKGDREPIIGYSVSIHENGIRFVTDYLPKDTVLRRFKNQQTLQHLKGCIAIPVELIESVAKINNDDNKQQLELKLNFLELRDDLLKPVAELTQQTLAKTHTQSGGYALKSTPSFHIQNKAWSSLKIATIIAITCLMVGTTTFFLGYLVAGHP